MVSAERSELESGEPFERGRCIAYSLSAYQPHQYSTVEAGRNFEERYLTGEVSRDALSGSLIIPAVNLKIQERVAELLTQNSLSALTQEQLDNFYGQAHQESTQVGARIRDKAQELGLVTTQTAEEFVQNLEDPSRFEIDVSEDSQYSSLKNRGWDVYPSQDKMMLIISQTTSGKIDQLDVVDLDQLFAQDPEFLKEQIKRHYELQGIKDAISSITYNLAIHEIDKKALVPDFLEELSNDKEKREQETRELVTFLVWFGSLDIEYRVGVDNFLRGLRERRQEFAYPDTRSGYLDSYLDHMIECPGVVDDIHQDAASLQEAYNQVAAINPNLLTQIKIVDSLVPPETAELLKNPLWYTEVEVSDSEERGEAEKSEKVLFSQFIEDTKGVNNPEEFLQELQTQLPKAYSLLVRFKEWLGKDYFKKDNFDEFVKRISSNLGTSFSKTELKDISGMVEKHLHPYVSFARENFPGIISSLSGTSIYNSQLRDTLSLLVIKEAQKTLEADQYPILRDAHQRRLQQLDQIVESMTESYKKEIKDTEKKLEELAKRRVLMKRFLNDYDISEETVNTLANLVRHPDNIEEGFISRDFTSFAVAFNALYLSKSGLVNLKSSALKLLIQEVFPHMSDEILEQLYV